jgi:hypothetical protein
VSKFKTAEQLKKSLEEQRIENSKFTWEKASKLLTSWKTLMKEGCVSEETYLKRRRACEGIKDLTDPCPNLFLKRDTNQYFCGSCGCGHRDMSVLFVHGKDIKKDKTIRLWMPTSNCPKELHKDAEGTGSLKPVGGKLKQLASLAKAALSEIGRFVETSQSDAVEYTQEIIEEHVSSEKEIEKVVEYMESDVDCSTEKKD